MNWADFVLIVIIVGCIAFVVTRMVIRKKKHKADPGCGGCSSCAGCAMADSCTNKTPDEDEKK